MVLDKTRTSKISDYIRGKWKAFLLVLRGYQGYTQQYSGPEMELRASASKAGDLTLEPQMYRPGTTQNT